jgi:hypothetical protein
MSILTAGPVPSAAFAARPDCLLNAPLLKCKSPRTRYLIRQFVTPYWQVVASSFNWISMQQLNCYVDQLKFLLRIFIRLVGILFLHGVL